MHAPRSVQLWPKYVDGNSVLCDRLNLPKRLDSEEPVNHYEPDKHDPNLLLTPKSSSNVPRSNFCEDTWGEPNLLTTTSDPLSITNPPIPEEIRKRIDSGGLAG
ncbi:hypothetical protein FXO38_15254 [Capsicum annuum]|nr:hypothetical protein FXO38_15254 [Capsicum annuum]KAF3656332.1 hypothetical protein FXO37_15536 [Capsicum annuum]